MLCTKYRVLLLPRFVCVQIPSRTHSGVNVSNIQALHATENALCIDCPISVCITFSSIQEYKESIYHSSIRVSKMNLSKKLRIFHINILRYVMCL